MNLFQFIHSTLEGCLLAKQLLYVAQFSESLVSNSSHDFHWDIKVGQVGTFLGNLYLCYKNRQEGSLPTLFLPLSKIKWDAWSCSSYLVTMKIKSQGANDDQVEWAESWVLSGFREKLKQYQKLPPHCLLSKKYPFLWISGSCGGWVGGLSLVYKNIWYIHKYTIFLSLF